MDVKSILLDEIACLHAFNHREKITTQSVASLMKSILSQGLQTPIVVRTLSESRPVPVNPGIPSDKELLEQGFKYKILSGHRRFTAFQGLRAQYGEKYSRIFANVRDEKDTPEILEYDLNALENLERKDLSPLEEAHIVEKYDFQGMTVDRIAEHLSRSPAWVRLRLDLLKMPKAVKELIHEGKLTSGDVRVLRKHLNDERKLLELAGQIRDTRISGGSVNNLLARMDKPKLPRANETKYRTKQEIFQLQDLIRNVTKTNLDSLASGIDPRTLFTQGGNSILTIILGWAGGSLSNEALYEDLEDFFEEVGIEFKQGLSYG